MEPSEISLERAKHALGSGLVSEMIERVGRALAGLEGYAYDPFPYDEMARTVIKAMREPTAEMRSAVENDADIQHGLDDCNKHDIPDEVWRLMIDAALKAE